MQTVCLVGKPNVGKSSIFNRLIKENKSIIMDTPGVTRDRIYGRVNHNDKSFYLIDTGGISLGEDDFAKDILVQATLAIDEADLVLFVVDGNDDPDASDKKVAEILHKSSKKVIVVVNKIDNDKKKENLYNYYELGFSDLVAVSASHNIGFDGLLNTITSDLPEEVKEEDTSLKFCIIGRPNVVNSSSSNFKVSLIILSCLILLFLLTLSYLVATIVISRL
jgi:GTPase